MIGDTILSTDKGSRGLAKAWGVECDSDHGATFVRALRTESGVKGAQRMSTQPAALAASSICGGSGVADGVYAART